ncbi:MAG: hypothetical protein H7338_17935 [Candidatus Sericytochromatia bacterium]|nr:hypothetical protein [Candidatus Sericytochromatia bacterium]
MRTATAIALGALGISLMLAFGCTAKVSHAANPGGPTPAANSQTGGQPQATPLAALPFQPRSGTWQVNAKSAADKFAPFTVVLVFQPNGLIGVNGTLLTDAQAANQPYNKDYIATTSYLGQQRINVIFRLGGQYTLTMSAAGQMEGVALVRGDSLTAVKLTWINDLVTPVPIPE